MQLEMQGFPTLTLNSKKPFTLSIPSTFFQFSLSQIQPHPPTSHLAPITTHQTSHKDPLSPNPLPHSSKTLAQTTTPTQDAYVQYRATRGQDRKDKAAHTQRHTGANCASLASLSSAENRALSRSLTKGPIYRRLRGPFPPAAIS